MAEIADLQILDNIPFELNLQDLRRRLHIAVGSEDAADFAALAEDVSRLGRPKAIYREAYVEACGDDTVTIAGVTFTSPTLRANLQKVHRVFAYVATCGGELDALARRDGDFLRDYWLDTLKASLLAAALEHLRKRLENAYGMAKASAMHPGSGDADVWPIQQQRLLFGLLGDVEAAIGVRLTDSFLMVPNKSVSGLRFPTQVDFNSCQLCHRDKCPSRRAAFDSTLWETVHGRATKG